MLVVGDDLTGSNATGARYARAGLRTISVTGTERLHCTAGSEVVVVNTGTRHCRAERAAAAVSRAVAAVPAALVVKRVDTTLRGNVASEVAAVLAGLPGQARALVVPAFPDAGRTTAGGLHLVDGVPLAESFAAEDPLTPVRSSRVAAVLDQPADEVPLDVVQAGVGAVAQRLSTSERRVVVCDATTNAHLATIAEAAASVRQRWVAVDTGPFGVSLAAALGVGRGDRPVPPVLAVVGSTTAVTREQLAETERVLGAHYVDVPGDVDDPDAVADRADALRAAHPGRIVGIRTCPPDGRVDPASARRLPRVLAAATARLLDRGGFGGLYASGGDIAQATTEALDSDGFAIETEVFPLAVAGRLVGGPHGDLPFATKGGLIGDPGGAVACLEHLITVAARRERGSVP